VETNETHHIMNKMYCDEKNNSKYTKLKFCTYLTHALRVIYYITNLTCTIPNPRLNGGSHKKLTTFWKILIVIICFLSVISKNPRYDYRPRFGFVFDKLLIFGIPDIYIIYIYLLMFYVL